MCGRGKNNVCRGGVNLAAARLTPTKLGINRAKAFSPNKTTLWQPSMSDLQNMRQTYTAGRLDQSDVANDPMVQFQRMFKAAASVEVPDWLEINAMTLSTTDGTSPTSRVVLLKGNRTTDAGPTWTFYSNYNSTKAKQIQSHPDVTLGFYWPHTQQQIRIEGTAAKSDRQTSIDYFHSRPRESQLGAVASDQSTVLASRETLQTRWDELRQQYEGQTVPCPNHWGGYDVVGHRIEFWQGRPGRLHDRLQYERSGDRWIIRRLAP